MVFIFPCLDVLKIKVGESEIDSLCLNILKIGEERREWSKK